MSRRNPAGRTASSIERVTTSRDLLSRRTSDQKDASQPSSSVMARIVISTMRGRLPAWDGSSSSRVDPQSRRELGKGPFAPGIRSTRSRLPVIQETEILLKATTLRWISAEYP